MPRSRPRSNILGSIPRPRRNIIDWSSAFLKLKWPYKCVCRLTLFLGMCSWNIYEIVHCFLTNIRYYATRLTCSLGFELMDATAIQCHSLQGRFEAKAARNFVLTLSLLRHTHRPYWHRWHNQKFPKSHFSTQKSASDKIHYKIRLSVYFRFIVLLLHNGHHMNVGVHNTTHKLILCTVYNWNIGCNNKQLSPWLTKFIVFRLFTAIWCTSQALLDKWQNQQSVTLTGL